MKTKGMKNVKMNAPETQLILPIEPVQDINFEQVEGGSAAKTLSMTQDFLNSNYEHFFYVTGGDGVGKSHILQASSQYKMQQGASTLYLSCEDCLMQGGIETFTPEMLEGLDQFDLLCIDDLSVMLQSEDMEEALFHLFNQMKDSGRQLMVSDARPPSQLEVGLPDLASRLQSGLVLKLSELTDDEKKELLIKRATERGFQLEPEVVQYLLKRSDRRIKVLMKTLIKLDRASLSHQRKLTIPFVKSVMGL